MYLYVIDDDVDNTVDYIGSPITFTLFSTAMVAPKKIPQTGHAELEVNIETGSPLPRGREALT